MGGDLKTPRKKRLLIITNLTNQLCTFALRKLDCSSLTCLLLPTLPALSLSISISLRPGARGVRKHKGTLGEKRVAVVEWEVLGIDTC